MPTHPDTPHDDAPPPLDRSVVIAGGGIAGIAAAVRLAEHGARVHLLESRPRLGGRATSWTDPETFDLIDNCQHVLLRGCTNLLDLYARLGVADHVAWTQAFHFADAHGHIDQLEPDDLPAPLHLAASLAGFHHLTWKQRFLVAKAMLAMLQAGPHRAAFHHLSFLDWLKQHGQTDELIERFWSLVIVSACNDRLDRVAADYAMQVFQNGFLAHEDACQMGVSTVPLVELYDPAERLIHDAGGSIEYAATVEQFEYRMRRVTGVRLASGKTIEADAYISAVPWHRLGRLCPPDLVQDDPRLQRLDEIDAAPIVGIHLYVQSPSGLPVMTLPHAVLVGSELQWVFNKGQIPLEGGDGDEHAHHLHGVISGAYDLVHRSKDDIVTMATDAIRKHLPDADDIVVKHARVIKETHATFSCVPGIDELRPDTSGAVGNLYLAGDWVNTGWPATMEGAARSGYLAAEAVVNHASPEHNAQLLAADLPERGLYRFMLG